MIRIVRNAVCAVAAAGLVIAQPAMATRSAESLPAVGAKVAPAQGQRVGSKVRKAENITGGFIIPLIVTIGVIGGILAMVGNHQNDSPG